MYFYSICVEFHSFIQSVIFVNWCIHAHSYIKFRTGIDWARSATSMLYICTANHNKNVRRVCEVFMSVLSIAWICDDNNFCFLLFFPFLFPLFLKKGSTWFLFLADICLLFVLWILSVYFWHSWDFLCWGRALILLPILIPKYYSIFHLMSLNFTNMKQKESLQNKAKTINFPVVFGVLNKFHAPWQWNPQWKNSNLISFFRACNWFAFPPLFLKLKIWQFLLSSSFCLHHYFLKFSFLSPYHSSCGGMVLLWTTSW